MRNFLLFLLLFPSFGFAQTFSSSDIVSIPDAGPAVNDSIIVSGLPNVIDSSFGLSGVCFDIVHTYDSDLKIRLKSPNGNTVFIANQVGGSDDNFTGTCLAENGASGYLINGFAPFTGIFIPLESLNQLNNGQDPNGTWYLEIQDLVGVDTGYVYNFSLTFSSNPPLDPPPPPILCSTCNCPDGNPPCDLLPDMTSAALSISKDIDPVTHQSAFEVPGNINFDNATPNIGSGPLETIGVDSCYCGTTPVACTLPLCPNGDPVKQVVHQIVYHKPNSSDTLTSYTRTAGYMSYHPTHGHIHVDHWADFTLRTPTSNPDATTWPIIGTGTKQSFCLINLGDCDSYPGYCVDTAGNVLSLSNITNAGLGFFSGCGPHQGIFTGNLDIYVAGLNMGIDLTGICNGDYYIVSITDPENNMLESNENNNWVAVPVHLYQQTPVPTAAFSLTQSNYQIGTNATGLTPGSSFVWNFGDGTTDTINNPAIHTYSANGTYYVTLTVNSSCGTFSHTDTVYMTVGTSSNDLLDKYRLMVSPVPVSSSADIKYYVENYGEVNIELVNSIGQHVASLHNSVENRGYHEMSFDFKEAGLSKGIYFVSLNTPERIITVKIAFLD